MHTSGVLTVAAALILPLLALAPQGASTHPDGDGFCPDPLYIPADSLKNTYPVYVAWDGVYGGSFMSLWIYAESNNHQGLQRGGESCGYELHWYKEPDTVIF